MNRYFNGFFKDKTVLVTGHTGFKGAWLSIWLESMGARVIGYALAPANSEGIFNAVKLGNHIVDLRGDIRDFERLREVCQLYRPQIVFHLAAQPLVNLSYKAPRNTFETNVMGTVNILECIRSCSTLRAGVIATSDKCYVNREQLWGYRETDPVGGCDPYSSSKGCCELITASYINSFFNPSTYKVHGTAVATARTGNAIGGGDWSEGRLIPDCFRAVLRGTKIPVRYPHAVRPWQHVLEPLSGYLQLARKLYNNGRRFSGAWNFGPGDDGHREVEWVVSKFCSKWGGNASYETDTGSHPHEAHTLKLDCTKAREVLKWYPRWSVEQAVDRVVEWMWAYMDGEEMYDVCNKQIQDYMISPVKK